jgi:hypothetical protein
MKTDNEILKHIKLCKTCELNLQNYKSKIKDNIDKDRILINKFVIYLIKTFSTYRWSEQICYNIESKFKGLEYFHNDLNMHIKGGYIINYDNGINMKDVILMRTLKKYIKSVSKIKNWEKLVFNFYNTLNFSLSQYDMNTRRLKQNRRINIGEQKTISDCLDLCSQLYLNPDKLIATIKKNEYSKFYLNAKKERKLKNEINN